MIDDPTRYEAPRPEDVLHFWFGPSPLKPRNDLWWKGGKHADETIRRQFGEVLDSALGGGLREWADLPRGRLALVVVLDQFTRNAYRGTARAFAGDERALALVLDSLERGLDRELHPLEACFFYMPMEHAESLEQQDRCVACFEALLQRLGEDPLRPVIQGNLDYAEEHRDIIRRFGRFPHRNAVLGRESTAAERDYLSGGGKSFGQG